MKKLGNGKGRRVHPAPPAPRDHLAALPAAVLALAAALTAEEQEVLAYLLSGSGGVGGRWREQRRRRAHPPELGCVCFGCYKSFWARWDASPNRHVIHRIIDAVEESLEARERDRGGGGRRRKQSGRGGRKGADLAAEAAKAVEEACLGVEVKGFPALDGGHLVDDDDDDYDGDSSVDDDEDREDDDDDDDDDDGEMNGSSNNDGSKSSVRRFMTFIGERVWGAWN